MGIGGATARRLAQDGARVLVADVEDQAAERQRADDPRSRRHCPIHAR
jgi:NAD(P)-dependent dehydrogenase (short-subunit alcohol dehydrogenase family)